MNKHNRFWGLLGVVGIGALGVAGCGGDARVEFAAADAMESLAAAMEMALAEYHTDLQVADDHRESAVIAAFVGRVQGDANEEDVVAAHATEFEAALRKLHGDRRVEWQRYDASMDNLTVLREMARDLRRLAVSSMTLEDETRRFVLSALEAGQTSPAKE